MSYFAATFAAIMEERDLTQADVSRRTGIPNSRLSRYLSDDMRPDSPEAIEDLAKAFPNDGRRLAIAWLRDLVPGSMEGEIEICEGQGHVAEKPGRPHALLPLLEKSSPAFVRFVR